MGCAGPRCLVWSLWALNLFISSVYLAISLVTFHNVKHGVKYLVQFENREAFKNSLLAACILGFLVVLFWIIFSFFVLFLRFFSSLPLGYGVMLGSCSHTGFFMLLCGLVLQTHESLASKFRDLKIWSSPDYQTYLATFIFNYILCGSYLIMFLVLIFTSGFFTKKEDRASSYTAKNPAGAPPAPPAASGTASGNTFSNIADNHGFGTNWSNSYRGGNV
ncbi:hypothetical protein PLESTB_000170000 [Pleodorina starrii]|uniref:Uncharacterized protein n=1 Tax=Pleodorina starrii TaxID=330485 RepID=A0A9W6BC01_9CHLO|nr:hypothetical protein PLESTB_000170000 [Pleodorina starrii]GLC66219.1 hypothetical protein PLESTF_000397800 [Pleodorina starrii]